MPPEISDALLSRFLDQARQSNCTCLSLNDVKLLGGLYYVDSVCGRFVVRPTNKSCF